MDYAVAYEPREFSFGQLSLIGLAALLLVFFSVSKQAFFIPEHKTSGQVLGVSTSGGSGEVDINDPNYFQKITDQAVCAVNPSCSPSLQSNSATSTPVATSSAPTLVEAGNVIARAVGAQVLSSLQTEVPNSLSVRSSIQGLVAGATTPAHTKIYPRGLPVE